jgi:hypothetical protein
MVLVAGDEVILPLLREQLSKDIADRVVDVLKLDIRTPEQEVLAATIATLRAHDAASVSMNSLALIVLTAWRSSARKTSAAHSISARSTSS